MAKLRDNFTRKETLVGIAACVVGNLLWGFSYLFTSVAQRSAIPSVQLSIRFIIAFVLLNILIFGFKRDQFNLKGKKIGPLILLGASLEIYYILESTGIYYTNSSFTSLAMSVVPVLSIIAAAILLKEYPTKKQIFFSIFPVAGVIIITLANSAMGAVQAIGVVIIALACLASCSNQVISRQVAQSYTPFERTYFILLICSAGTLATALVETKGDLQPFVYALSQPSFVACTLALSICCSIGSSLLVNFASGRLTVIKLTAIGTLPTPVATLVGILLLREPVNAISLVGVAITLFGIWQVSMASMTKQETPAEELPAEAENAE